MYQFCVHSEDDSIGSSAVNRFTCSINAFGLKAFLSYMMFYCVKSHKKFKILDTFDELLLFGLCIKTLHRVL